MFSEEQKIIKIVKKTLPAVVNIVISKETPEMKESLIPKYGGKQDKKHGKLTIGGGSGFIISKDGMILTNRHVISEKDAEYKAVTADGKKHNVKIIAKDPINDIAVLKINANNSEFPIIALGDSDKLELGQTVIVIGNALAIFSNSISKGIISGLSRLLTADSEDGNFQNLRGLIQTDAAINIGNSGGPLLNLKGEAIGINTAILHDAENIGFAIPINNIKRDLENIKKYCKIIQPYFGVRNIMINQEIQKRAHLPINYGAWLISEHLPNDYAIAPESPAEKAGLAENDIILEFNGQKIDFKHHLQDLIRSAGINKEILIKILRNGENIELKVMLTEQTDS